MNTDATKSRRETLRSLATAPTGTTCRDAASVLGLTINATMGHLRALVDSGVLIRVDDRTLARFFVSAKAADSFRRLNAESLRAQASKAPKGANRQRAWWPADAVPYFPPGVKVQRGPSPANPTRTNTHEAG